MIYLNPPEDENLQAWLEMNDVRRFLVGTVHGSIPVYYKDMESKSRVYLSSVLLPCRALRGDYVEQLLDWHVTPEESGWGYGYSGSPTGKKHYQLFEPFDGQKPGVLGKAASLYTLRENLCVEEERRTYIEVNPQITHVHELHWVEERSAYCTLDETGDIREVIHVTLDDEQHLVTIPEDVLFKHLLLGDYVLVRFFDVDRFVQDEVVVPDAADYALQKKWEMGDLRARWTPVKGDSGETFRAFLRGFQIMRPPSRKAEREALLDGRRSKQYSTFIAYDWKHKRVAEVSCDPSKIGNYFVDSPHPYEISPAFFKREVLRRYQDDPDKYSIAHENITCRSAWSLRFSINEAGQVQVYLKDLATLPSTEQLYWKSFNEQPEGGISETSYRRDFLGEWYDEPEPLRDLKALLENFPAAHSLSGEVQVWHKPAGLDANLADHIHYLATASSKEWETEIVALDRFVVEGLNPTLKHLRRVADTLNIVHDKLGSITLLRDIIIAQGIAPDIVGIIIDPLRELQNLRSKFGSHRKGTETTTMAREIRRKHKDLAAHYHELVERMYTAMNALAKVIENGHLNLR